jgi:signal transduction histidine kinase
MRDADDDIADQLREALQFLSHDAREGHSSTLALLELSKARAEPMALNEVVQRIERNSRRALMRIDDFVALAQARSQPLRAEELDLLELLYDAVAEAWHAGNERGVRLKVVDAPEEALLQADRSLLRSAIAGLLQHALGRARRRSELACAVHALPHAWSVEVDEVPDRAGVASAAVEASPAEARHGWALVELVARRMGGAVEQQDVPGHGVRLRVTLPRA